MHVVTERWKSEREKEGEKTKKQNGGNCAQVRATSYTQCAPCASFGPVEDYVGILSSLIAFTFTTTRLHFFGSIESRICLRMNCIYCRLSDFKAYFTFSLFQRYRYFGSCCTHCSMANGRRLVVQKWRRSRMSIWRGEHVTWSLWQQFDTILIFVRT